MCAGPEFKLGVIMAGVTLLEVIKAMYGFPTSGNRWQANFLNNLIGMGFKPTRFNPHVCIKVCDSV